MSSAISTIVRRCPTLANPRARALVMSIICLLVVLMLRLLYVRLSSTSSARGSKRGSSRGSRPSKEKKHSRTSEGHSSKHRKKDPSLPSIVLLIGIHGSGKSFWAKRYTESVHKSYVIIAADVIRSRLTGTIHDFSKEDEVEEEMLKEVAHMLELRRSCIVDDCRHNLSPDFRAKIKALAPDGQVNRLMKMFSAKPSYAMTRIQNDVDGGLSRHVPTLVELEKQVELVAAFEQTHKEEGWMES